ncbi:AMY-1-associating protein expressed in testis 1 [Fasciola hepatica]|uniref:Cilia- and flagella-associated protein 91 n=1 Tax=Fasciola hepatica TaxID=6192 RepID=A0A4E0R5J5_FASHE|nr:AMY-1-associating protein expressed in testis 1 [Fasciola hepatica]
MTHRRSSVMVKERQHDYLYDPVYTLSGIRDHERAMRKSVTQLGRLEKLFNFNNLFSEISLYKPFTWQLSPKDPVPDHVNREFNAQDVCDDLMKRMIRGHESFGDPKNVIRRERAKFFNHYRAHSGKFPANDMVQVDMAIETLGHGRLITTEPIGMQGPNFVSRAIQTVYRDSEAQTDPYTPPYVVNVGETPEVLTLATLGYGRGLPAGLHDVEMIERARERRKIENSLEPYSEIAYDPKRVERRRKILQDLELREWHFREQEVEALQEVRMKVLVQLLRKREEHEQEAASRRLDRMWEERCAAKEAQCKKIQHQFVTAIRKLMRKRLAERHVLREKGRDVICEYSDPSSRAFAPLTRLGVFPDRASEANVVKSFYLNTYEDGALNPKIRARRKPRFLEKIERAPPRPATPSITPPKDESVLERELAAVILQQLIRGRAIQTQMYEGKEKHKELIEELRSTHALLEDEIAEKRRQKHLILSTQNQHAELLHRDNEMDNILGQFECGSLADMLDFLSKELDRLIEERRIHALVLLAERHRRMREAEESGNRQREERRRREQDEVFKQLVKVHQDTVDGYLASVAGVAIDTTADTIAQREVDELARQVDIIACDMEVNRDAKRSELIAADLVHNFLIPEVNRRSYQAALEKCQRPLLLAAHREIWGPAHSAAEIEPLPKNEESFRLDVSTMTSDHADVTLSKPSFTEHTGPNEVVDAHNTIDGD